ncbi:MAG: ABC transporter ATP-binding protein [Caulobacteraceae bacterium]
MTPALRIDRARVNLGGRRVLDEVDLEVFPGEVLGLLGANGAGKTTLLRAAVGLAPLASGEVRLGGRSLASLSNAERAGLVAYLPQERRVGWNLPAWRIAALGAATCAPAAARRRALEALENVGMGWAAERGVLAMSGGERARVLIARLVAGGAPLLVADEAAAGLDPEAQFRIMALMRARAAKGTAVLATLHDLTLAARACDRVAVLFHGRIIAAGPPGQALSPAVLAEAFALEGEVVASAAGPVLAARRLA